MKKLFSLLLFTSCCLLLQAQNQWTWINGDKSENVKGIYGTQGVASPSNIPGGRTGAAVWTDKDGNFWLFGGIGKGESNQVGRLNDLWKFNPSTKQWTWISGNKNVNTTGTYGERGIAMPTNQPGARQNAVTWRDSQGNFWMFGGLGMAASKQEQEQKAQQNNNNTEGGNTNTGGSTPGTGGGPADNGNDGNGNNGNGNGNGHGHDNNGNHNGEGNGHGNGNGHDIVLETGSTIEEGLLNDLWMYSPSTGIWTWINGSYSPTQEGDYGEVNKPSASNHPGARYMSAGWIDGSNNLYLFGGRGLSSKNDVSDLNDVWKFSPANKQWTWLKGDKKGKANDHYGKKGEFAKDNTPSGRRGSTTWIDKNGTFWLFGGGAKWDVTSDLWKYDPSKNQWAWISGSKDINRDPRFTDKGVPGADNDAGARMLASGWVDKQNNLWLFGGEGYDKNARPLNNLWKYAVATNEWTFVKGDASNQPRANYGTKGQAANDNVPGGTSDAANWQDKDGQLWIFGGYNSNGNLNSTWKFAACLENITGNISPATGTICEGGSLTLTATGGSSYQWLLNNNIIEGQSGATLNATKEGTYSVMISKGGCSLPALNNAVVTKGNAPTGNITPANAAICNGNGVTLTATGGTSYTWMRDGQTIDGQTSATLNADQPGTYSTIITNGTCTGPAANESVITLNTAEKGMRYDDVITAADVPTALNAREIGVSYQWLPVDGLDNPQSLVPNVTIKSSREYYVNITTDNGCVITDTVLVKIKGEEPSKKEVVVPSAFTPDGNNVNDLLRPLGKISSLDYFRVFNRWGQMLYQTNVVGQGWDGRFNGVAQPADTYTWVMSAKTWSGQTVKLSGKTLLIR